MENRFPYTGESAMIPLFPGKYRVILAQPKSNVAGDILKGTIEITDFTWGFVNVGAPSGFNAGRTDFRIRNNIEAELVMATPGDNRYVGYISGYPDHEVNFRGYEFTDIEWNNDINIGEGYATIEAIEEYPLATDLFNLKSYYDIGEYLEIVMPNNRTLNKIDYKYNGIWREVYTGRETTFMLDTSRANRAAKIRYRVEIDGEFVTVGESKTFVIGSRSELEATVNLTAGNRFFGTMDIVPPPYITHDLEPLKDSLVRKKAPIVNYGDSSSLTIGQSEAEREEFETYMGFSLESVPVEEEIDDARLVLSLKESYGPLTVKVFEADDDWFERTVRWENRPEIGEQIYQETVTPNKNRQLELDLTSYVTDWYLGGGEQRSFAVVLETETDEIVYFSSKESSFPPLLKVSYYKIPPNAGVYYMDADVLVSLRDHSELNAYADIVSQFVVGELPVDIEFPAKPGDLEMDADVLVSVVDISDLLVDLDFEAKHQVLEMDADIYVRGFSYWDIDAQALMEKKQLDSELDVDLVIKIHDQSELEADLEIEIKWMEDELDVDMLLRAYGFSDIDADVGFENKYNGHQIDADVEIRSYGDSDMLAEVEFVAKTGDIEIPADAEFFVKEAFDELRSNMILSIRWASELDVDLEVEVKRKGTYAFFL